MKRPLPPIVTPANAEVSPRHAQCLLHEDAGSYRHDGGWRKVTSFGMAAAGALLLAACSAQADQPGTVTADEAQQLNDAAEMLDANSVDINAVDTMADPATNESTPR